VLEGLEVLELSLGGLVSLGIRLVEELAGDSLGLVVDVGGDAVAAPRQLGHIVEVA